MSDALGNLWAYVGDWYPWAVLGAIAFGIGCVLYEVREMKRHNQTHRQGR